MFACAHHAEPPKNTQARRQAQKVDSCRQRTGSAQRAFRHFLLCVPPLNCLCLGRPYDWRRQGFCMVVGGKAHGKFTQWSREGRMPMRRQDGVRQLGGAVQGIRQTKGRVPDSH